MSYYYYYYAGYRSNGKIYPLGPYNDNGKPWCILYKSKSYASGLYKRFSPIIDTEISQELIEKFTCKNLYNEDIFPNIKVLSLKDMPSDDFIKTGYFLIEDVEKYQRTHDSYDCFYESISPEIYSAKLKNEIMFGKNQPQKDCEGYEYTAYNASDYMYFAYPDFYSIAYESFYINEIFNFLNFDKLPDDKEFVVLMLEG